jgi:competence ComEA-like helix-hairpin-helix protein
MVTRDERRALIFLAVVTAAGGVIRATRGSAPGAAAAAVAPDLPGQDIVRQAALSRQAEEAQRPLGPGERVDVDRASAVELERLPRVGKRLAQRIAADRQANGPFRSLAGLGRVAGVSARLLSALAPYVTFGGTAPPAATVAPLSANPRPVAPQVSAPPVPPAPSPAALTVVGCLAPVAVNRATREDLLCLPGVGPVLAGRIVAEREARGPFRNIGDLARVPGIGPAKIERLKGHVTIP